MTREAELYFAVRMLASIGLVAVVIVLAAWAVSR